MPFSPRSWQLLAFSPTQWELSGLSTPCSAVLLPLSSLTTQWIYGSLSCDFTPCLHTSQSTWKAHGHLVISLSFPTIPWQEREWWGRGTGGESQRTDVEPLPTPSPPCPSPLLPALNIAGKDHLIFLQDKVHHFSMNAGTLEHFFANQWHLLCWIGRPH